jgi:two-component system nitrogen regulation response regulator NtrX
MKPRILIVDDEKNITATLSLILGRSGYDVRTASSGEAALKLLGESPADLVLLDVGLPGVDGLTTLREIMSTHPGTAVIMISGQATISTAIEATKLRAFDFLEKPLSKDRVLIAVRNALDASRLGTEVARYRTTESRRHAMIGESEAIEALRRQIGRVGPTSASVLITGESGTGKELVARALHDASPRVDRAFIKVNCAAIPEDLIETELFGCVRGAYTGADRTRDGKFLLADGGTLFLDEIGDMSLRVQAKVLRALQEGDIERVGDSRVHHVDVRVIAATNKDLQAEARAGRYREDLYFRLNVIPIHVPPLRSRADDIPRLAEHFLHLYAEENVLPVKELSPAARGLLRDLDWPGNIRELKNVIERLAILSEGATISPEEVSRIGFPKGDGAPGPEGRGSGTFSPGIDEVRRAGGLVRFRRDIEKRCIEEALDRTGGNVSEAARLLAIERSNLHKKMQAYGLEARPARPTGSASQEEESL